MSASIYEVTKSQILDWCQTGRLAGGSDARVGQWLVMRYGCEFARPLRCVKVFSACDSCQDAVSTVDLFDALPDGVLGWEFEVWHVVSEQDLIDNTPVFPALAGFDFVSDYDKHDCSTLIMHWVPALGSHVAVLVTQNGIYLPNDLQSLQPKTMADVRHYDWLPCEEFGDFGAFDYLEVLDQLDAFQGLGHHDDKPVTDYGPFDANELYAYLGDYRDCFDVDAIIDESTYVDARGNRRWLCGPETLCDIVQRHDLTVAC